MGLNKILGFLVFFFLSPVALSKAVLTDMDGKKIPFSDLKGKWVLINYWASWCQPCLDEIPVLNQFYQNKKQQVVLFGVNYDGLPLTEQLKLIKQHHIRFPALQNDPGQALHLGDIRGVPATFVFNPQGKLSDILYGGQTLASLEQSIK